jgi:hypothetical protein
MSLPPLAILVTHAVSNYDTWKGAFDAHQPTRKRAGILGHHINRGADGSVCVYLAATDREKLAAFLDSSDLKATMKDAGVASPPAIVWLVPVEDSHIADRNTAAMIVSHDVADYAAWKKVYDSVAGLRQRFGIIGAAVNQVLDAPNKVVVYHQAETRGELEAFAASDELKSAMKAGGVTSAPQIRYFDGLPGAKY